ncbi:alpha-beta hydrolase superfamily lysophospholipase [Oxalobacteraceae bacterium GrIS 2.11]
MAHALESRLGMNDGTELFIRDWLLDGPETSVPVPCIVIMHGLGEHCGRYQHVAPFLNACGFSVRTFDLRGHGQSDGPRADIPNPLAIIQDAEFVIGKFALQCQTTPILFGHSMGGLFAARIATAGNIPLRGLILSSPALALRLGRLDRFFLKVMSAIAPHFAISNNVSSSYLSHNPALNSAYDNDPLVHKKITASLLNAMLDAISYAQTHAPILTIPTLLLVAGDDHLIDPQGSQDFFGSLPSNLGTAHFYPDLYHEILNELDASKVFSDMQSWLSARNFIA